MNESEFEDVCCQPHPSAREEPEASPCTDQQSAVRPMMLSRPVDQMPFVAQAGSTLYLVAGDAGGWVLAELEFEAASCTFSLRRQIEYQWPREALGRLLSRMLASEPAEGEIIRLSDAFSDWLADQFAA